MLVQKSPVLKTGTLNQLQLVTVTDWDGTGMLAATMTSAQRMESKNEHFL